MGGKETEEAIADSRVGRVTRFGSVARLMADLNADDVLADANEHPQRLAAGRRGRAAARASRSPVRPETRRAKGLVFPAAGRCCTG